MSDTEDPTQYMPSRTHVFDVVSTSETSLKLADINHPILRVSHPISALTTILQNMQITLFGMGSSDDVEMLRLDVEKLLRMLK